MHGAYEDMKMELYLREVDKTEKAALEELLQKVAELICNKVDVSEVWLEDGERTVAYTCIEMLGHESPVLDLVEEEN